MHGIIFAELKKYVDTKFGGDTWNTLLKDSGMWPRAYLIVQEYPDQEAVALVSSASKMTGKPVPAILEDFGEFVAPALVNMYSSLIKPEWKTLDLIGGTEEVIHRVVRMKNRGAKPPELKCRRPGPDEVVITYSSPRKMCAVAKGVAKGVAKYYKERVRVMETSCMLAGSPSCQISVKLV